MADRLSHLSSFSANLRVEGGGVDEKFNSIMRDAVHLWGQFFGGVGGGGWGGVGQ